MKNKLIYFYIFCFDFRGQKRDYRDSVFPFYRFKKTLGQPRLVQISISCLYLFQREALIIRSKYICSKRLHRRNLGHCVQSRHPNKQSKARLEMQPYCLHFNHGIFLQLSDNIVKKRKMVRNASKQQTTSRTIVWVVCKDVINFEVILVGREINGKNDLETLCLKIHLFCHETKASLSQYFNRP